MRVTHAQESGARNLCQKLAKVPCIVNLMQVYASFWH